MKTVYVAIPISLDPEYARKKKTISEFASREGIHAVFPMERGISSYEDTVCAIKKSSLVLLDLSFERPSIYFELALALGLGVCVFVIAKNGTELHQIGATQVHWFSSGDEYEELVALAFAKA